MRIDVLTLFPAACEAFFSSSILGRAQACGAVRVLCHDIRRYSTDPHRKVDDKPYGGGPGMVMTCQPVFDAVEALRREDPTPTDLILLTPQGRRLDQEMVRGLAVRSRLILVAGHYEGFDDRIRQGLRPAEISIGDYVLSGGEAAAMVLVDAVVRLLPGVLGDAASHVEESFSAGLPGAGGEAGLLEYPQYTRPREFRGMGVPEVLINGDHARIRAWRREQALRRTAERRPDLLRREETTKTDELAETQRLGADGHAEQNDHGRRGASPS